MRTTILWAVVCVVLMLGGCAGPRKYAIVSGESFASTDEAVQEARLAINTAAGVGYKPVSIGGGAGAAGVEVGGKLVTVYVLLEGPANAPDILSTGIVVP